MDEHVHNIEKKLLFVLLAQHTAFNGQVSIGVGRRICAREFAPSGDKPPPADCSIELLNVPVSYTHLDVYKRQILGCGSLGAWSGGSVSFENRISQADLESVVSYETWLVVRPVLLMLLVALVIWAVVAVVIGGTVTMGYAKFNLNLVDRRDARLDDLFSRFSRLGDGLHAVFPGAVYFPVVVAADRPRDYGRVQLCHDALYSHRESGHDGQRSHLRLHGTDAGQLLAPFLPGVQLYRLGHFVRADAGDRLFVAEAL